MFDGYRFVRDRRQFELWTCHSFTKHLWRACRTRTILNARHSSDESEYLPTEIVVGCVQ